ncbi:MAG: FtsX-like permease family protein [Bacteroidales bacterium]|jgi:putative ABC transport system permease protein|nr:FtsX-like permease family protein [Bacteroidales bacterium]
MLIHNFKTAIRNFLRNKSITFIKILGLSLGMASIFFILIFIIQETSYNQYLENHENIYRIIQQNRVHHWETAQAPYQLRDELLASYPEIEKAARVFNFHSSSIAINQQTFPARNYICTDSDFFEIFKPRLLSGTITDFEDNPYQIAISRSTAEKFFGTTDVINKEMKILTFDEEIQVLVKAVYEDFPITSTLSPDFISPLEMAMMQINKYMMSSDNVLRAVSYFKENWELEIFTTYILYDENANPASFREISDDITARKFENPDDRAFYLQQITDVYLQSQDIMGGEVKGNLTSIYIFSAVALLVLIIASINYIILSTSQIVSRTREVGVRKILGAHKRSLLKLLFTESFIVSAVAFILAFIIIEQFRPIINHFFQKQIIILFNWEMFLGTLLILGFVAIAPAVYMMYYFNKISPVDIMRKKIMYIHRSNFSLKKIMLTLQYFIFIGLVIGSIGIVKQLRFAMHSDLGFNPENKLVIPVAEMVQAGKYQTAKQELLKINEIVNISGAMWLPPSNSRMSVSMAMPDHPEENINVEGLFVDKNFIETFDLKLVEGNSFSIYGENAEGKVIINENARQYFELGDKVWGNEIVGVVKDFNYHSLHESIGPMFLVVGDYMIRNMVLSYHTSDISSLMEKIDQKLSGVYPQAEINYSFLTENFDELYKNEKQMAILISIFSLLAIVIASLGLLGITIFTTKKQTKNIAIRKVNGASTASIFRLFMSDYVKLIFIALIIASPVTYYILHRWLQNFAYQTQLSGWMFILAGLLALFFTLITISWYSLRAARRNPVESLRYE